MSDQTDPDFVGCLAGNLRAAARLVTRHYDAALRPHGLRITQVALMAQIRQHQTMSLTALGHELATERSVVARDVAVLERLGLVTVSVDPEDRRARNVALTAEGARRLRAAAPAWRSTQRELREQLGPALADDLLAVSRRVVATIQDQ